MPENNIEQLELNDIHGLVVIPDDSIYYFSGVVGLGVIALILIAYYLYRYLRREKKKNYQKVYLKELNAVDLADAKQSAYTITHFGGLLEKDEEQQKAYLKLVDSLEVYKYKKVVNEIESELDTQYKSFLGSF